MNEKAILGHPSCPIPKLPIPEVLKKIAHLRSRVTALQMPLHIEVDGGINAKTGARCRKAGADYLVAGSYVLCSDDPAEAVRSLKTPL